MRNFIALAFCLLCFATPSLAVNDHASLYEGTYRGTFACEGLVSGKVDGEFAMILDPVGGDATAQHDNALSEGRVSVGGDAFYASFSEDDYVLTIAGTVKGRHLRGSSVYLDAYGCFWSLRVRAHQAQVRPSKWKE